MQSTWPSYYKAASSLVLCCHSAASAHLSSTLLHLLAVLSLPSPPRVLLVFTHTDSPFALSASMLDSLCRFDRIEEEAGKGRVRQLGCNSLTGEGCEEVLCHMADMASSSPS